MQANDVTEVHRIARAAADDGPVAYETGLLAKLGAGGSQLKNASRDFARFVKPTATRTWIYVGYRCTSRKHPE